MTELTLSTPSILFSAISLILLAYTNRFLSYAQVVRTLKADYDKNPSTITHMQLANLRRRLYMARSMQLFGVSSLLLCVVCTFLIYIGMQMVAVYTFGIALVLLTISLGISIRELLISVRALELHLDSFERMKTLTATSGREGNIEPVRRRKTVADNARQAASTTEHTQRSNKSVKSAQAKSEPAKAKVQTKATKPIATPATETATKAPAKAVKTRTAGRTKTAASSSASGHASDGEQTTKENTTASSTIPATQDNATNNSTAKSTLKKQSATKSTTGSGSKLSRPKTTNQEQLATNDTAVASTTQAATVSSTEIRNDQPASGGELAIPARSPRGRRRNNSRRSATPTTESNSVATNQPSSQPVANDNN